MGKVAKKYSNSDMFMFIGSYLLRLALHIGSDIMMLLAHRLTVKQQLNIQMIRNANTKFTHLGLL